MIATHAVMLEPGVEAHGTAHTSRRPAATLPGPVREANSWIEMHFAVLAARYGDVLRRYLRGLTRRPDVADDLTQQLWLKLLEAARAGRLLPDDDPALRSYLFVAARNLYLDHCVRKHGSSRTATCDPATLEVLAGPASADGGEAPEDACDRERLVGDIQQAIGRLPRAQQAVIRLWMAGASIERMVTETCACRDTVLSRKKYAFRRLRLDLGERSTA